MSSRESTVASSIAGMLVLTVILGGLSIWLWSWSRSDEFLKSWTETTGRVKQVQVDDQQNLHRGGSTFRLHLEYSYAVAGTAYSGSKYHPRWEERISSHQAEEVRAACTPGSTVAVYFNPNAPQQASLTRGSDPGLFRLLSVGAGALLVLLWAIVIVRLALARR